ncbi:AAA family ATPase [Amycolatopsis jejuensis]|uniref:AAA family ATPase n=1 Tax=Amycolatopsis jejuensis TaxID=330084 RepID=UPI0006897115|nr:AAA family ATPase [Amycolatopsis jejuensis]
MVRLIHLNGPSGIGKSTVARHYADLHPGVLDLEADQLVPLIGGWRTAFWDTLPTARRLAVAMAEAHLRAGQDVIMPQLATRLSEVSHFEEVANAAGGQYLEIMLTAPRAQAVARFRGRRPSPASTGAAGTTSTTCWPSPAGRSCSTGSTITSPGIFPSVHNARSSTRPASAPKKPALLSWLWLPGWRQKIDSPGSDGLKTSPDV